MTSAEELRDCIGTDAMQRLCERYGGTTIYIPVKTPEPDRNTKIRRIFTESLKGATCMAAYRHTAEDMGLSIRRVQQIVAGRSA